MKPPKYKVSELEGNWLDAAVALAEGMSVHNINGEFYVSYQAGDEGEELAPHFSSSWNLAGPIIEREWICIDPEGTHVVAHHQWTAIKDDAINRNWHTGRTPLIAAMRAYVESKFGDEVQLP